jgi:hypothetical protein
VRTRACALFPLTAIDWIRIRGRRTPRARSSSTSGHASPPACLRVAEASNWSQIVAKSRWAVAVSSR